MLMQFIETIDDGFWTDVFMLIQASDVCAQLRHIVGIILIIILILVEPIEFRISATLEFMAEDVVLTLFRHPANGHLFLSLMGTVGNGCTLIIVSDTRNGSVFIDFVHFILILFNFQLNFCRDSAEIMQAFSTFAAKKFVLFGKYV